MKNDEVLFASATEIASMAKGVTYINNSSKCITSVAISSKDAVQGSLFVALKGAKMDGHDFIGDAIRNGAVAVLANEKQTYKCIRQMVGKPCSLIIVQDTLEGLQSLARNYAAKCNAQMIGITGSCGKTTTKEILASILGMRGTTAKTPGNLNSLYGLPLSLFHLNSKCRYGVFELGVDHVGEMDTLSSIVNPDIAIITNICESHLEKFGSIRNLIDEKRKIFGPQVEKAYISEQCQYKHYIAKGSPVPVTEFGVQSIRGLESVVNMDLNGWVLKYNGVKMHLNCLGWHSLIDCICAIQVADELGCTAKQIAEGVNRVVQIPGRSKVYEGEITVIDDSYNANYESSYAILDAIEKLRWKGRKNLAFGSMKELGSASSVSHRMLGKKIGNSGASNVFLYGKEMEEVYSLLKNESFPGKVFYSEMFEEIQNDVVRTMTEGDLFLLKGSRVMQMERLLPTLLGQ
ncbi:MAG: UDP-N-acetylmuramoyl-tripeptide--D-alanyl-D-alanine ligase [Sphaerochaetaceae bacterium]